MGSTGRRAIIAVLTAVLCHGPSAHATTASEHLQQAAADGKLRDALVREGRGASFFCANCHGDAGASRYPEVPNLAGQNPAYIVSQIEAFLAGRRRNEFMEGLMKVLGERDKAAIALYYAGSPPRPSLAAAGSRASEGAELYKRFCRGCHQTDAHGSETFPRLAGQQPQYLRLSLQRYLNKSGVRNSVEMSAAVAQLGEPNIEPIVAYLSSLK